MRYRTIVADPPWPHDRTGYSYGERDPRGRSGKHAPSKHSVPYPVMAVDAIASLMVSELSDDDAHLYLWTTQRYLLDAHGVAEQWGFRVIKLLVWCKPPAGFSMGPAFGNACEFVIFARRGKPETKKRISRDWWEWSRSGGHSGKPEAFLDLVEQVSPGPYLELFARRQRFGWDTWGDQALEHVELSA